MPNNTTNIITVTEGIEEFLNIVRGKKACTDEVVDFTFNSIISMDKDIDNPQYQTAEHLVPIDGEHPLFNWFDWSCDHWGTKWDAYDVEITRSKNDVVVEFYTAWSAPIPVYNELIKKLHDKISLNIQVIYEDDIDTVYEYNFTKTDKLPDDFEITDDDFEVVD